MQAPSYLNVGYFITGIMAQIDYIIYGDCIFSNNIYLCMTVLLGLGKYELNSNPLVCGANQLVDLVEMAMLLRC